MPFSLQEPDVDAQVVDGNSMDDMALIVVEETQVSDIEEYYAIIMISGELPGLLMEFEPINIESGGAASYEIPRSEAETLIDEIAGLDGVVINRIDELGSYALVLYSPG